MTRLLLATFLLAAFLAPVFAQDDQERSWQKCTNDISVSLILRDNFLRIHIKNTSAKPQTIFRDLTELYYVEADGTKNRLRYYGDERDDIQERTTQTKPEIMPPGQEIALAEQMSAHEMALIKIHPVVISIAIFDQTTKKWGPYTKTLKK